MSGAVEALGWALVHSLWQLALVGLGAWLLMRAAGPGRARAQYRIAFGALVACLVLPVLSFLHGLPAEALAGAAPVLPAGALPALTGAEAPAGPGFRALLGGHLPWLAGAWGLGVLAMAGRLGGGFLTSLRWRREALAAPGPWVERCGALARRMGAGSRVLLLASTRVATPVAMGLWRPVVLVPAALFTAMPEAYLEALLAHELAHVVRLDFLFNLLQSLVEVLCFHHPVVWWLSRRVRTLREHLCDDLAAKAIGEPRRLALALDALDDVQPLLTHLALAARGGPLYERIARLLKPQSLPTPWTLAPVLALLLPCAGLVLRAQEVQPPIAVDAACVAELDALARKEGLDPQLLRSMAWAESAMDPKARSTMGATGLLQVMPATARKYGARDLADPHAVAAAGARYLRVLLDRYHGDLDKAVAAYNCGEEALDAGRAGAEALHYRALVLDLLRARAVQPAGPLAQASVEGNLRLHADGKTWTLNARISHLNGLVLEFLPADGQGKPYGRLMVGDGGPEGSWRDSSPRIRMEIPRGAAVLVRCATAGWTGSTRLVLDGEWKTFAFRLDGPAK